MFKYEIIIYWSKEDEAYIAEVPELPGCVAHRDTYDETLASAKQAIELWIETAPNTILQIISQIIFNSSSHQILQLFRFSFYKLLLIRFFYFIIIAFFIYYS